MTARLDGDCLAEREAYPPLPEELFYTGRPIWDAICEWEASSRGPAAELAAARIDEAVKAAMCAYVDADRASRAALSASKQGGKAEGRCKNCDDTGDVHSFDGEWRGICHCPAGDAIRAPAPAAQPKGDKSHE